jgi:hypothetical protein
LADDANTAPDPGETGEAGKMIPMSRFSEVCAQKQAFKAEAEAKATRIAELETQLAESTSLQDQLNTALADLGTARFTVDAFKAGLQSEEGIAVAQALHGLLPEEGRPSEIDWIRSLSQDPSKAPAGLQPYFGTTTATPAPTDTGAAETEGSTDTGTTTATAQGTQGTGGMSGTNGGRIPGSEHQIGDDLTREQKRQIGKDMQSRDPAVAARARAIWKKYQAQRV